MATWFANVNTAEQKHVKCDLHQIFHYCMHQSESSDNAYDESCDPNKYKYHFNTNSSLSKQNDITFVCPNCKTNTNNTDIFIHFVR